MKKPKDRLYRVWSEMKYRCLNANNKRYALYGARGITVCPEWVGNFQAFKENMGPRPVGGTLERIDNNLGYSPENCRWATHTEQMRNTRTNVKFYFNGTILTMGEWALRLGMNVKTLWSRYYYGWTIQRILTTPVGPQGGS